MIILYVCGVIFLANFAWNIISALVIRKGQPYRTFQYNLYVAKRKKFEKEVNGMLDILEKSGVASKEVWELRDSHVERVLQEFDKKHRPWSLLGSL